MVGLEGASSSGGRALYNTCVQRTENFLLDVLQGNKDQPIVSAEAAKKLLSPARELAEPLENVFGGEQPFDLDANSLSGGNLTNTDTYVRDSARQIIISNKVPYLPTDSTAREVSGVSAYAVEPDNSMIAFRNSPSMKPSGHVSDIENPFIITRSGMTEQGTHSSVTFTYNPNAHKQGKPAGLLEITTQNPPMRLEHRIDASGASKIYVNGTIMDIFGADGKSLL